MRILPQSLVQEIIDYSPESGDIINKNRPRSLFSSQRAFESWNERYPGKPVERFMSGTCTPIRLDNYPLYKLVVCYMTGQWPRSVGFYNEDESDLRWHNLYYIEKGKRIPFDGIKRSPIDELAMQAEKEFDDLPLNQSYSLSPYKFPLTKATLPKFIKRLKEMAIERNMNIQITTLGTQVCLRRLS